LSTAEQVEELRTGVGTLERRQNDELADAVAAVELHGDD
jgi:hypothetical protein